MSTKPKGSTPYDVVAHLLDTRSADPAVRAFVETYLRPLYRAARRPAFFKRSAERVSKDVRQGWPYWHAGDGCWYAYDPQMVKVGLDCLNTYLCQLIVGEKAQKAGATKHLLETILLSFNRRLGFVHCFHEDTLTFGKKDPASIQRNRVVLVSLLEKVVVLDAEKIVLNLSYDQGLIYIDLLAQLAEPIHALFIYKKHYSRFELDRLAGQIYESEKRRFLAFTNSLEAVIRAFQSSKSSRPQKGR